MDSENVEHLLDYVYNEDDFDENISMNEFKKLGRIMKIMVSFYERGSEAKLDQKKRSEDEVKKVEEVQRLMEARIKVLEEFPSYHPKKQSYESDLKYDLSQLLEHKKRYVDQLQNFTQLYEWGLGIVETMQWLQDSLVDYASEVLNLTELKRESPKITTEKYLKYKRGLEEVTYNLQESQDFFEASLDGRLQLYHQLEKCMIEAQIGVLHQFSDDNPRKSPDMEELQQDLEFIITTMTVNPTVTKRRERMKAMHSDFFAVLKWQRERLIKMIEESPDRIDGDVEELKEKLKNVIIEINELRQSSQNKKVEAFRTMQNEKPLVKEEHNHNNGCPREEKEQK